MVAYVRLCFDVLGDVLQFGTRRHLSALERIGRHFHAVIAQRFVAKPFLNLNLRTFFYWPAEKVRGGYVDGQIFPETEVFMDLDPEDEDIKTDV